MYKTLYEEMEKDSFFDVPGEESPSTSSGSRGGTESLESKGSIIPNEWTGSLLFPFFIELINQFKNTLKTLRHHTQTFQEKTDDKEFGPRLIRMITKDIKKIELVESSVLNYLRISNPIIKTNTIKTIIEEELKKYQADLEEKKIKLYIKLEKDLPETIVPEDQLRYILTFVLQYAITLIPSNGSLWLLTRSLTLRKETGEDQASVRIEGKYIEVVIVYPGDEKPIELFGVALGIPVRQKEGLLDLLLRLADEVAKRNQGMMKFEVDEKKGKTTISLRFPVERRKVVYCQPLRELHPSPHQSKTTFEKLSSLEEMKKRD